jgi:hypothetical protein
VTLNHKVASSTLALGFDFCLFVIICAFFKVELDRRFEIRYEPVDQAV